jgi:cytochrome c553
MAKNQDLIEISEIKKGRGINENTKVLLFAKSAGRCEICNKLVIKDSTTREQFVWGEMAHIYAFSNKGPRANKKVTYKNNVSNLLLACPDCHEKIDKAGQDKYYTAQQLQDYKSEHEKRIQLSTSFDQKRQTKVLKIVANINSENVKLATPDIIKALMKEKLIPCEDKFEEVDFSNNPGQDNGSYWKSKSQDIDSTLNKFYSDLKREKIEHVSIFGIGPMPLLMYLGSKLDNKIKTKIFQRHRDGENWEWKNGKPKADYQLNLTNKGQDKSKVALLLSLSGTIKRDLLPMSIDKKYHIYELSLVGSPNYNFLRTEKDLLNFEKSFSDAISKIKNEQVGLKNIDVFPAVPAPVAIVCGRSLNKHSDPKLKIYNTYNKGKFKHSLTIN